LAPAGWWLESWTSPDAVSGSRDRINRVREHPVEEETPVASKVRLAVVCDTLWPLVAALDVLSGIAQYRRDTDQGRARGVEQIDRRNSLSVGCRASATIDGHVAEWPRTVRQSGDAPILNKADVILSTDETGRVCKGEAREGRNLPSQS
jgi:hypothetical protein